MRVSRQLLHIAMLLLLGATSARAQVQARAKDGDSQELQAQNLPLRLSLLDTRELMTVPTSFTCQESTEEASRRQFQVQMNAVALPLARRLTLHGFSRWGCALSSGAGASLTHAVQLSPNLTWVLAGGVAVFPHILGPGGGWLIKPSVRADLQWNVGGRKVSAGVDALQVIKGAVKAAAQRRVGASISGSF